MAKTKGKSKGNRVRGSKRRGRGGRFAKKK